jgi:hypothetical protein
MAGPMPRARTYYVRTAEGTVTDHPTLAECGRRAAEVISAALWNRRPGEPVPHPRFLITGQLESRDFPGDWHRLQVGRFVAARDRALGIREDRPQPRKERNDVDEHGALRALR